MHLRIKRKKKIDIKNQAEALCLEAEKELSLLKENISEQKQENIQKLIENVRQQIQNDDLEKIKSELEQLKTTMKDIIEAKAVNNSESSDSMSDLNDL